MGEFYRVIVTRVKDGDTFVGTLIIPVPTLQMKMHLEEQVFRLNTADTPELSKHEPLAEEARDYTIEHLLDKEILVQFSKKDAFGRWLTDVYLDGDLNNRFNDLLLKEGLAHIYKKGE
ncbi:thermonuclease family protein [Priestia megaterium]|uniref:thermonuclease family protein n=1 Tax=Priestia megaterium TaxID=1404 RepID=UPI0028557591|nr:thermonuclease family protein [Priestia megaterium]MDR7207640.1 micrococcal nuclease [Priestia megaterium]